jgi:asparagine synthase (glutamine-hydrolysing)
MCGIAGVLDPEGVGHEDLWKMGEAIAHRGPDDATIRAGTDWGFAFRRLSIIDLEGGRQPISNEDGTVHVILNGEIYNFQELRAGLLDRGHVFSTRADTEVLVHLYEEMGTGLVDELRGMFAFAIWDETERKLLLARDHLGQKPLFWARNGSRFMFGSEIKAIIAADTTLRRLNHTALHEYLSLRIIADPRSMFEGVHKLPPGHVLEVDHHQEPRIRRYWRLRFEPKSRLDEREALDHLDRLVRETVRLHLVSDVEVGAFLSGGLDSGLITAMMAREGAGPFKTFSGSTPYQEFDEAPAARQVAELYGTDHRETAVTGELMHLLPALVHHLDEPSDPLSLCLYRLAELASREVKVVLGGDGGDELFGGYDRYYGTGFVSYYARIPRVIRDRVVTRMLDRAPDGFWYKSLSHRVRWMNELARVPERGRYARSLSYFYFTPELRRELYTEDFSGAVEGHDPEEVITLWEDDEHVEEALDRMLLADTMVRLPNHPVMIMDRMTMAHGLEARSPLLDHRLAEFVATLPPRMKIRGTRRRYLETRLAERYLPRDIVRRPKQGFSSAVPYLMREQFESLFAHFLPTSRLVGSGLLRSDPIQGLLGRHLGGQSDHGNRLWLLLNAELWYRMCIEEEPAGAVEDEIRWALDHSQGQAARRATVGSRS